MVATATSRFPEGLRYILEKMCEAVGANIEDVDFNKSDWYTNYSWTEKQEKEFNVWLVKTLKEKEWVRKDITHTRDYEGVANNFLFQYGWKISTEKERVVDLLKEVKNEH